MEPRFDFWGLFFGDGVEFDEILLLRRVVDFPLFFSIDRRLVNSIDRCFIAGLTAPLIELFGVLLSLHESRSGVPTIGDKFVGLEIRLIVRVIFGVPYSFTKLPKFAGKSGELESRRSRTWKFPTILGRFISDKFGFDMLSLRKGIFGGNAVFVVLITLNNPLW